MTDASAIGQQFVTSYYQTFDLNRGGLASLYVSLSRGASIARDQID